MKETTVMMMVLSGLFYLPGYFPHLYNLVEYGRNWTRAQEYCRNKYTDLAIVHNEQDLAKLRNLTEGFSNVWIGLIPDTEAWKWSLENQDYYGEGETEFRMWNDGEPNGLGHHKVCAAMLKNGKWADVECNSQLPFFCYNKNTSRFIFVNMSNTWEDAQSYCRKNHTDLASVRNQSENEELKKITVSSYTWIGLYRNSWKWSDGTAQLLHNWDPDKPSKIATDACGTIFRGKWVNYHCGANWYFVCYTALRERKVLKIKLKKTDPSVEMEDLEEEILEKFRQRLTEHGPSGVFKLQWVKQPDGKKHVEEEEEVKEANCGVK
ncbi:lymphocyte antigen 75-like [Haplochromis burtoni]|uniref:lymphocyte antigen 75-like n=1 Tax=Haplochromis burtoni TaxID=8153 RepID=UPI0006C9B603|nr:lymphocyte antigen 75-like [Haplochromis burtoni]